MSASIPQPQQIRDEKRATDPKIQTTDTLERVGRSGGEGGI
jgi:hypothetical protein